jgi:hypothetical protein
MSDQFSVTDRSGWRKIAISLIDLARQFSKVENPRGVANSEDCASSSVQ